MRGFYPTDAGSGTPTPGPQLSEDDQGRAISTNVPSAHPFSSIDEADLGSLLERVGDCSVVLLGEASHGTSEFYAFRDRLTRELILRKGFRAVAVEADAEPTEVQQ